MTKVAKTSEFTPEQLMERTKKLSDKIISLLDSEVKEANPDGKMGMQDILVMGFALDAVRDGLAQYAEKKVLGAVKNLESQVADDLAKDSKFNQ